MITVKVIRVPGSVTEVALEDDATVADALAAAETSIGSNESLSVNAETATGTTTLSDGDRVILAKSAKGNA